MNLIFDANYFGYRALHVAKLYSKSKVYLSQDEDKIEFLKKLKNDFIYEIKKIEKYGNLDKIIFAMDGRSWRKALIQKYKGSRSQAKEKDGSIDYNSFYKIMDNFVDYLVKEYGIIKTYIENAEADDLIYFWKTFLMHKGQNNIIITVDKDLYQLVGINETNNFTIVYNNNSAVKKLIVDDKLSKFLHSSFNKNISIEEFTKQEADSSNNIFYNDIKIIEQLLNSDLKLEIVDIENLVMEKIFLGDTSDEIDNVLIKQLPTKKRPTKINRANLKALCENLDVQFAEYNFTKLYDNFEVRNECAMFLSKIHNLNNQERQQLAENIYLNCNLITLNEEVIPTDIQDEFVKILKELSGKKPTLKLQEMLNAPLQTFVLNVLGIDTQIDDDPKIKMYFSV